LRENVTTNSKRAQRRKLFERKLHHCVSSKSQIPKKPQITKSQTLRQARRLPYNSSTRNTSLEPGI
jgi:hypothetical protein